MLRTRAPAVLLGWRGDDPLNAVLTARRYALHDRRVADEPREQQRAREYDDRQQRKGKEVLAFTACLVIFRYPAGYQGRQCTDIST